MDQLYELMRERLNSIENLKQIKTKMRENSRNNLYQEISKEKKNEKMRILKQNNSLEALFTFRQSSQQQRQAFEAISFEVMKAINQNFEFEVKDKGLYADIEELYYNFFMSISQVTKAEQIRSISQNTLYQNNPYLCLLLKWLIQVTRRSFMQALKIENSEPSENIKENDRSDGTKSGNQKLQVEQIKKNLCQFNQDLAIVMHSESSANKLKRPVIPLNLVEQSVSSTNNYEAKPLQQNQNNLLLGNNVSTSTSNHPTSSANNSLFTSTGNANFFPPNNQIKTRFNTSKSVWTKSETPEIKYYTSEQKQKILSFLMKKNNNISEKNQNTIGDLASIYGGSGFSNTGNQSTAAGVFNFNDFINPTNQYLMQQKLAQNYVRNIKEAVDDAEIELVRQNELIFNLTLRNIQYRNGYIQNSIDFYRNSLASKTSKIIQNYKSICGDRANLSVLQKLQEEAAQIIPTNLINMTQTQSINNATLSENSTSNLISNNNITGINNRISIQKNNISNTSSNYTNTQPQKGLPNRNLLLMNTNYNCTNLSANTQLGCSINETDELETSVKSLATIKKGVDLSFQQQTTIKVKDDQQQQKSRSTEKLVSSSMQKIDSPGLLKSSNIAKNLNPNQTYSSNNNNSLSSNKIQNGDQIFNDANSFSSRAPLILPLVNISCIDPTKNQEIMLNISQKNLQIIANQSLLQGQNLINNAQFNSSSLQSKNYGTLNEFNFNSNSNSNQGGNYRPPQFVYASKLKALKNITQIEKSANNVTAGSNSHHQVSSSLNSSLNEISSVQLVENQNSQSFSINDDPLQKAGNNNSNNLNQLIPRNFSQIKTGGEFQTNKTNFPQSPTLTETKHIERGQVSCSTNLTTRNDDRVLYCSAKYLPSNQSYYNGETQPNEKKIGNRGVLTGGLDEIKESSQEIVKISNIFLNNNNHPIFDDEQQNIQNKTFCSRSLIENTIGGTNGTQQPPIPKTSGGISTSTVKNRSSDSQQANSLYSRLSKLQEEIKEKRENNQKSAENRGSNNPSSTFQSQNKFLEDQIGQGGIDILEKFAVKKHLKMNSDSSNPLTNDPNNNSLISKNIRETQFQAFQSKKNNNANNLDDLSFNDILIREMGPSFIMSSQNQSGNNAPANPETSSTNIFYQTQRISAKPNKEDGFSTNYNNNNNNTSKEKARNFLTSNGLIQQYIHNRSNEFQFCDIMDNNSTSVFPTLNLSNQYMSNGFNPSKYNSSYLPQSLIKNLLPTSKPHNK